MKRGESKTIARRWKITRCDSPRDDPRGPMGGWWSWKLGILGGRNSWIVELVYYQFRIERLHTKARLR